MSQKMEDGRVAEGAIATALLPCRSEGKDCRYHLYMHRTKMVTPFHRKYAYTKKYVLYPNQLLHHLCMHTSLVCIVFSGRVMHTLVGRIMGIYGIWECQLVSSVWS